MLAYAYGVPYGLVGYRYVWVSVSDVLVVLWLLGPDFGAVGVTSKVVHIRSAAGVLRMVM